ncbi:hypothetical protein [Buttiauxella ferragutiae]|uniref:hypothetical protein n=1 Tax=Buttiauxella ferragutiae TaxID=82989 RepID=UPI0022B8054F|nr:hypothetical protein [Buttiauxella ferragutiae]
MPGGMISAAGNSGHAEGSTQAAIADGSITIRDKDKQQQDVADLSRDTDNANGHIDKIFDKEKIQEQQELAAVFGQMANQVAGDIGVEMGWGANSPEKAAIHGVIGAIQASFGGGNVLAGGLAGMGSEALGQFVDDYLSSNTQLGVNEKAAITQWAAALGGAAVGGVTGGSNGAMSGAATALDSVRYNYLDHKQIEEFAEKTKGCEARNDCQQIVKEMEALSLKQQQEMIAVCASDPVGCKTIYGDIPGNGMLIREAIDKVLGADVPWSMKNDMSSLLAQQIEAEGVVSSTEFAQRLQNRYGIDPQQAEILAGAAMAAVTGGLGKYQPNKGAVGNMGEFFKQTGFGSEMMISPLFRWPDLVFHFTIKQKIMLAIILLKAISTTLMVHIKII